MVFIRFQGFILGLLLVSFALQNLSVHADHHQERRLIEGNSDKEAQESDASLKKELVAGTWGIGSESKEVKIGGRKMGMMLKKEEEEEEEEEEEKEGKKKKEDGEMASRSNTDKNASKEGPQDFLNNQEQENMLGKMTIKSHVPDIKKQGFSRSVASPSSFNTDKIFSDEDQSDEWRKLLEEADQKVMQMMRRDYSGMRKPRRKPPINNHEPIN